MTKTSARSRARPGLGRYQVGSATVHNNGGGSGSYTDDAHGISIQVHGDGSGSYTAGQVATQFGAGANNIGHITGLVMERCDDSLTVTQYYIDRLHPEQSLIYRQEPTTAREFPMLLGK